MANFERALTLTSIARLLKVSDRKIRGWIDNKDLEGTRTPMGFAVHPDALLIFLRSRFTNGCQSVLTFDVLVKGELVTIPHAAARFGLKNHELYRARAKGELQAIDLSHDESRGLRVCVGDVDRWAHPWEFKKQPSLPAVQPEVKPEPALEGAWSANRDGTCVSCNKNTALNDVNVCLRCYLTEHGIDPKPSQPETETNRGLILKTCEVRRKMLIQKIDALQAEIDKEHETIRLIDEAQMAEAKLVAHLNKRLAL